MATVLTCSNSSPENKGAQYRTAMPVDQDILASSLPRSIFFFASCCITGIFGAIYITIDMRLILKC
jgi:hypothetical protein